MVTKYMFNFLQARRVILSHVRTKCGIYTILVIGKWPVLFLVIRELAIFKNVNGE